MILDENYQELPDYDDERVVEDDDIWNGFGEGWVEEEE